MALPNPLRGFAAMVRATREAGRLGGTIRDLGDQVEQLRQAAQTGQAVALPRNQAWATAPFAPGLPLVPSPINPARRDTGRPEPRLWEYPVSWNLPGTGQRLIPWQTLRDAADRISLFRRCIEVRKDHMAGLRWDVILTEDAVEQAERDDPSTGRSDLQRAMRQRLAPDIARLVQFWEQPDRGQGHDWTAWLSQALEELLVLDALPIYPRHTFGGDLYSFEVIDGTTIKPLLDERGGRPAAPLPAYQQILYGFPRGEFTAATVRAGDDQLVIPDAYAADELVYVRRSVRTWTPYGNSPVEQALDDGDLYLKRRAWMRGEYTHGTSVAGLYRLPVELGWSPEQLLEYERAFNDALSGSTEARQEAKFLPPGAEPVGNQSRDALAERYKPEYDLHLIKLVLAHFDTTLPELGFTEAKGLGSQGYHEGQENVQHRKTLPITEFFEGLLTRISRLYLGMPQELEFKFLGLDDEDESTVDEVADRKVRGGRSTLNEERDRLGKPRYTFPDADKPFIVTGSTVTFLEGASERPADPAPDRRQGGSGGDGEQEPSPDGPGGAEDGAVKAELVAYRRWVKRAKPGSRPFRFAHLEAQAAKAAGVDLARVAFAGKAGDADPKAPTPETAWPGWQVDLAVAAEAASVLSQGLTGALPPADLIDAWVAFTASRAGDDTPAVTQVEAWQWLHTYVGDRIVDPIREALTQAYTEGYLVGDRSATSILTGGPVEWGGWTPGHPTAARRLLSADGRQVGLDLLLSQSEVPIKSIGANRLDDLAGVLADGLDAKQSPQSIAEAVEGLLDDPQWAEMVTLTELNRAQTAAAHDRYEEAGVQDTEWMTAFDERVCKICNGNEDAGPVPLGERFPSGDFGPPGHPRCRCVPLPVIEE